MGTESSSSGGTPGTATLRFGPSLRHAAVATAAAATVAAVFGHAGAPPAVHERWLPVGTWCAQQLALLPSVAMLALVGLCVAGAGALLYDGTRRWALPSSAADATWWLALSPFAAFAWGAPLWGVTMVAAAGYVQAIGRDRMLVASTAAAVLSVLTPGGVLFVAGLVAHYVAERAWRMGPKGALAIVVGVVAAVALPAVALFGGTPLAPALLDAWWGGPAPWAGLDLEARALPLAGAALACGAAVASIGIRPTKAPVALRGVAVLGVVLVAGAWACGDDSGAAWGASLCVTPAAGLLAGRAEQHRWIARLCWTVLPLIALLAR